MYKEFLIIGQNQASGITYQKKDWQSYTTRFQALQSLSKGEFELLLEVFQPIVEKYYRYNTLKGGARVYPMKREPKVCSIKGSSNKLFFILYCLKNNYLQVTRKYRSLFDVSQGKVNIWIAPLLPLLREALSKLNLVPNQTTEAL